VIELAIVIIILGLILSLQATIISSPILVWEDGIPFISFGQYTGRPLYEVANSCPGFVMRTLQAEVTDDNEISEFCLCLCLAIVAEGEDEFIEAVEARYGQAPHDCTENVDWELMVDGCRDYQEAHHVAHCAVCGEDVSEEMELFDDREPEYDNNEEEEWFIGE